LPYAQESQSRLGRREGLWSHRQSFHVHLTPIPRRPFLSRARDPGHKLAGKRNRQAAEEAEAVGDYLDSRCSDFSDEGEDASCAYQGLPVAQGAYQDEDEAEAETEATDLAWRRGASPAAAYGGGGGVWGLWPTTSTTTYVEPGVRPRREKAMVAVRANVALERASGKTPKGTASCPPTEEARSRGKLAMKQEERARPSTLSVLAEAAGVMQER